MLVLELLEGERMMIGDDIIVKVVAAGRKVRLGIDAPPEVSVDRESIYESKKQKRTRHGQKEK